MSSVTLPIKHVVDSTNGPGQPGRCKYSDCQSNRAAGLVTCSQHGVAYPEWRNNRSAARRRDSKRQKLLAQHRTEVDDQPSIKCPREGCTHWFVPKNEKQEYHNSICARLAYRARELEAARIRKQRKQERIDTARLAGVSEEAILKRQIDEYYEKQKDPTYYETTRYRNYSTLMLLPARTRALGRSVTTGKKT